MSSDAFFADQIAMLVQKVNQLEAQQASMEMDIDDREQELARAVDSSGGGRWTGVVWFANDVVKDYSKVGADPTAAADPAWVTNNVEGIYLVVNMTTGACSWSDDATTLDNTNEQAFWVADSDGAGGYTLNHHTQGDIHARIT